MVEFVTYRRADGGLIFGEYQFFTEYDGLEEENCDIVQETWELKESKLISTPVWSNFTEDTHICGRHCWWCDAEEDAEL